LVRRVREVPGVVEDLQAAAREPVVRLGRARRIAATERRSAMIGFGHRMRTTQATIVEVE